ncbi:S9 family peptidase [Nonomuraea sp. NPDC049750]|uniref:S9 family peptidase n=1 Tax=Nonomuraea sp. NPDC049750 TaxID=3154738 RepID=UPI003410FCF2
MPRLVLDDLYRIAVPSDPRLRPDGDAVAYTLTTADRDSDQNQAEIWLAAPGSAPRRLASGSAARWSPDGRLLAFLRPVDGRAQIHLLPMEGGEPRPLTSAPLGAGAPVWSPDGSRIAYSGPYGDLDPHAPVVADILEYKADGAGLLRGLTTQLFVVDVATGDTIQVTEGGFHAGEPSWSPDGRRLAFAASMAPDRDLVVESAVYEVDATGPTPGKPERLTGPDIICTGAWWLAAPDRDGTPDPDPGSDRAPDPGSDRDGDGQGRGDRLVVAGLREVIGHTRLYTLGSGTLDEVETGLDRNVMTGAPGYPGAVPALLGDDLLFCARDQGRTHLYRLAGAPPVGEAGTEGEAGTAGAGTEGEAGRTRQAVKTGETGQAGKAVKIVGNDFTVSGVSVAAGRIAWVASSPLSAGDVYLDGEPLTHHALPDVDLFTPRPRTFTAPDGATIEGFVLRDETRTTPGPLLLDVHGGPHNAWSPAFDGAHLYHQRLAADGWTVLLVNPRASDGYGEDFFTATVGAWGLADEQDFLAAVDDLVAEGVADPDRLAVAGYSYGGYMACWLSTRTDRFKAAIPGGCVSDLASMAGTSDLGSLIKAYECRGDLQAQSPIAQVARVTTPTLLLHGDSDDRCPVGQAEQWFAALREQGVPVRLVRYPDASHLFILNGRPSHRYDFNERIITWLEQWVTGSPS